MRGEDPAPPVAVLSRPGNTSTCVEKTRTVHSQVPSVRNTSTCVEKTRAPSASFRTYLETPPHAWRRPTFSILTTWNFGKHLHMRGEDHIELDGCWPHDGNTSTCVEKTSPKSELLFGFVETPPHAWRRPHKGICGATSHRNTSTCVEKTGAAPVAFLFHQKHLHMRGEDYRNALIAWYIVPETPPHAWRRRKRMRTGSDATTETPPHAWRRLCERSAESPALRKHLHMRGEDDLPNGMLAARFRNTSTCVEKTLLDDKIVVEGMETPPHAWRRPIDGLLPVRRDGNTSTCVEKTLASSVRPERCRETPPHAWRRQQHLVVRLVGTIKMQWNSIF